MISSSDTYYKVKIPKIHLQKIMSEDYDKKKTLAKPFFLKKKEENTLFFCNIIWTEPTFSKEGIIKAHFW